ncbi:MAG: hypothetical protein HYU37_20635 [Acidobacteria bacterium]|nr:hypothetical protein [Acidobacteriota bacterium]
MALRRSCRASCLLIAALAISACHENGEALRVNAVGPSLSRPTDGFVNVARGALVQPPFIDPIVRGGGICPAFPPLLAPFTIVFEGDGRSDRFFSHVQMQFVDRFGIAGGLLTLGRTELATRFGSIALPAFGTRAFPFSFPFGCVGAPTGVLTVIILTADGFGRETLTRLHVPIR